METEPHMVKLINFVYIFVRHKISNHNIFLRIFMINKLPLSSFIIYLFEDRCIVSFAVLQKYCLRFRMQRHRSKVAIAKIRLQSILLSYVACVALYLKYTPKNSTEILFQTK